MTDNKFNDRQSDATGLVASLNTAMSEKPFLGDHDVIDGLVRELAAGVMERFSQVGTVLTRDQASEADQEACHQLARILIGENSDYTPVPWWSDTELPNRIRSHMGEAVHSEDNVSVVAQAIAVFVHNIYDHIRDIGGASTSDVEDRVRAEVEETIRSFVWLLLGLHQHD